MRQWGGPWTISKLEVFEKYLRAYLSIFEQNERARALATIYLDGFAGSGSVTISRDRIEWKGEANNEEDLWPIAGSAARAHSVSPGFDKYVLVDSDSSNAEQLSEVLSSFPEKSGRTKIVTSDCNEYIPRFVQETDWSRSRALALLDPFAMALDWSTIELLGRTRAVDLWLLFPLHAINRMLPRSGTLSRGWEAKLTRFLGNEDWKTEFYKTGAQPDLFTELAPDEKHVTPVGVSKYFNARLQSAFGFVVNEPMVLRNRLGTPIFVFMFAASNPKGGPTAVRIAEDIIVKELRS